MRAAAAAPEQVREQVIEAEQQYKAWGFCTHCNNHNICMPHTRYCAKCAVKPLEHR